jgi:hypothetical protein
MLQLFCKQLRIHPSSANLSSSTHRNHSKTFMNSSSFTILPLSHCYQLEFHFSSFALSQVSKKKSLQIFAHSEMIWIKLLELWTKGISDFTNAKKYSDSFLLCTNVRSVSLSCFSTRKIHCDKNTQKNFVNVFFPSGTEVYSKFNTGA